jgi:ribosomal protein S18 acetylase RimI-like enzyme
MRGQVLANYPAARRSGPLARFRGVEISRLGPEDAARVVAASALFDGPATEAWAALFLARDGHHLLMAAVEGTDVGFVSGVETTHPDKGTEMFLYELGVDEAHRRRGVGRALVAALGRLAVDRGCVGMWVGTEADNAAAIATYRSAGAAEPEPCVTLSWTFAEPAGGG